MIEKSGACSKDRKELCRRLIEAAFEEERGSDRGQSRREALAWVEAQRSLEMLDRQVGSPAQALSNPLRSQPRAKLGLSARARSTSAISHVDVLAANTPST